MKRPFSDEGGWYYVIMGILNIIVQLPLIWVSYMFIKAAEYWPLILFGVIMVCMSLSAYYLFCKAREKFLEDRNKWEISQSRANTAQSFNFFKC